MKIQAKNDYSALFSSLNKNSNSGSGSISDLSGLLSDYSTIKSGAYGKLMKAYYSETSNETASKVASSKVEKTESALKNASTDAEKIYNKVSSAAGSVQTSVKSIAGLKDDATEDEVYNAVSSFVKDYNSLLSSAEDAGNTAIDNRVTTIKNATAVNEKTLNSIGISIKDDGTLSVDKEKLASADRETIDSAFADRGSYGYSVSVSAGMAQSNANYEATRANLYNSAGTYNAATGSLLDSLM